MSQIGHTEKEKDKEKEQEIETDLFTPRMREEIRKKSIEALSKIGG